MTHHKNGPAPNTPCFGHTTARKRIGLLGGSFNPAHEGHLYISLAALRYLGLDEIWWLVSPQNPLKSSADMRPFDKRFQSAQKVAGRYLGRQIHVMDLERALGTQYSVDTIQAIKKRNNSSLFVWIMGLDTFRELHLWKDWHKIVDAIPIAVFRRRVYNRGMMVLGLPIHYCKKNQLSYRRFQALCQTYQLTAPAVTVVPARYVDMSATQLRQDGQF